MKVRAVICDIYKTLLDVGPPPPDAASRWEKLCRDFALPNPPSLSELEESAKQIIARQHEEARAVGVLSPEIFWPDVIREALPAVCDLSTERLGELLFAHAQLQRTLTLMSGAGAALARFQSSGIVLGIASNSQPYTLHELAATLVPTGLRADIFQQDVSFFSFEAGFSKPNPHVFRWLTARLWARGIAPAESLMIGDRLDNDIEPARAQGFQTWRLLRDGGDGATGGTWEQLLARME